LASIQEMKDGLEAEKAQAAELADKALSSIDTVLNAANFWLTFLSVGISVLGLIGLAVVWFGARRAAEKIAEERIKSYIETAEGKAFIQASIAEEVEKQIRERTLVMVTPPQPQPQEDTFKRDPKEQPK